MPRRGYPVRRVRGGTHSARTPHASGGARFWRDGARMRTLCRPRPALLLRPGAVVRGEDSQTVAMCGDAAVFCCAAVGRRTLVGLLVDACARTLVSRGSATRRRRAGGARRHHADEIGFFNPHVRLYSYSIYSTTQLYIATTRASSFSYSCIVSTECSPQIYAVVDRCLIVYARTGTAQSVARVAPYATCVGLFVVAVAAGTRSL